MGSFSIVLWEMLALEKPYEGYSGEAVKQLVGMFDDRPRIPSSWPKDVKKLLRKGWCRRISSRSSMEDVCEMLSHILDPSAKPDTKKWSWLTRRTNREQCDAKKMQRRRSAM